MKSVLVVGAGVTGLTVADGLARAGLQVTVVERGPVPGGLARSFRYGPFAFDVGPHRFHSDDPAVVAFVRSVLADEAIEIARSSAVRAFGRTHAWPLRPRVLRSLPVTLMLRGCLDLLRRERIPGESFEAEIVNRYGRALYEVFFAGYTERFLGVPPVRVHRDWARAGVDRAVIDPRVRASGLLDLVRGALLPKPVETTFVYPRDGIGRFAELLALRIAASGGRILYGREVSAIEASDGRVAGLRAGGERLLADAFVWTAPVTHALRQLGLPRDGLEFLSTVLYNVELRRPSLLGCQWVYMGDDEVFVRVSDPSAFSPATAPPGRGALCAERTCREGDESWVGAERNVGAVLDALVRNGFVSGREDVAAVHVERVPDTYPVYVLGYREALARSLGSLGAYRNLVVAGRSGRFWYNNMDHSIGQGLRVAAGILRAAEVGGRISDVDVGSSRFWEAAPDRASG